MTAADWIVASVVMLVGPVVLVCVVYAVEAYLHREKKLRREPA